MLRHPLLFFALYCVLYSICTYKSEKTKKMLRRTTFSKQEQLAGKVYAYAYFLCFIVCFFSISQRYYGTSELIPFLRDFALSYIKYSIFIDIISFSFTKLNKTIFKKILYAASIYMKISPTCLNIIRLFGIILYVICILFEALV